MNLKKWRTFVAIFLSGIVVMMGQFKVPPLMSVLIPFFSTDTATGGWLMSSFSIAGVVLGLPAAAMLKRFGVLKSGLFALACSAIGNTIGAFVGPNGIALLLVARVIEGVGVAIIGVVAPTAIAAIFGEEKRGLPLGIWSTWIATGMLCIYPIAVPISQFFGSWHAVWLFSAALSIISMIVFAIFVRDPEQEAPAQATEDGSDSKSLYPLLMLSVAYVFFAAAMSSFNTYAPSYIEVGLGLSTAEASALSVFISIGALIGGIFAGSIVQKTQAPMMVLRIGLLAYGIIFLWAFGFTMQWAIMVLSLVGFIKVSCPTAIYDLAPRMVDASKAGFVMGVISVAQNVGMVIGAPIVGAALGELASANWSAGSFALVAMCAIALAFTFLIRDRK
ncbi:MAG: MFS transporter [Collinsella sp.]|nr:MFS transporter [Collinsella sp.]